MERLFITTLAFLLVLSASGCEEQQSTADDPEWQAKIAAHPLWQQERARQRRDLMETDPQAIRARAEQENALVLTIS